MKNVIEFENVELEKIQKLAGGLGLPISKQKLTELAFKIANNSIQYLDAESFEQVNTNLV